MLPEGMRILGLYITSEGGTEPKLWTIRLRVAYADDDTSNANDWLLQGADGSALSNSNASTAVCKGSQIGTQFCSVSELSTTVLRRIR
jgi:hypothetical protein